MRSLCSRMLLGCFFRARLGENRKDNHHLFRSPYFDTYPLAGPCKSRQITGYLTPHPSSVSRPRPSAISRRCQSQPPAEMAVAQKTGTVPKWNPGKWKHGPKPAVCPSCLILSPSQINSLPRELLFAFLRWQDARAQIQRGLSSQTNACLCTLKRVSFRAPLVPARGLLGFLCLYATSLSFLSSGGLDGWGWLPMYHLQEPGVQIQIQTTNRREAELPL